MNNKTLFHILLVITFIFAGLSAFAYLVTAATLPQMKDIYNQSPTLLPEQFGVMMQQLLETPRGYFLGAGILYLLEVLGAALMWRLRWSGFHCYTLARLLLLLLPLLFLGRGFVGIGDIMMALLFIVVYFLLMRQLTANEPPQQPNQPESPTEENPEESK